MFKLGVITDEVSQDFEAALQFAKKHQLDCVELRSAWEKDPFEYTEEDIAEIKRLSVRSLYEPGNDIYSPTEETPFPEGFEYVKNTFAHVHVKDAVKENGTEPSIDVYDGKRTVDVILSIYESSEKGEKVFM